MEKRVEINWALDDEEIEIVKDYVNVSIHNKYMPFEWWEEQMREEIIKHHNKKLENNEN